MCECGCTSGNQVFKLKAPRGWYVIELLRGCHYCSSGPGLQIYHSEAVKYLDDVEHFSVLPTIGKGEHCISMIKCGLNPDETEKAAIKCFVGTQVDDDECQNGIIDEPIAEILGEDFWKDALTAAPSVIYPKEL